ncbi:unnamed protein product [Amoebophrya sp. A25]|nr:unnamed protein product [Amoebophrya sp. A25]|eukprot:GSA25T00013128001.1
MASGGASSAVVDRVYDVIIAGAGLSGLTTAMRMLEQRPQTSVLLLESSAHRIGGRILSPQGADLGPAWIWPHAQPRMMRLLRDLDQQNSSATPGQARDNDSKKNNRKPLLPLIPQESGFGGEARMRGGLGRLIEELKRRVEQDVDQEMDAKVVKIVEEQHISHRGTSGSEDVSRTSPSGAGAIETAADTGGTRPTVVAVHTADGRVFRARQVVLAFPPKKVLSDVKFAQNDGKNGLEVENNTPLNLSRHVKQQMANQPVWMGPAGKIALFYREKWWSPDALMRTQLPLPRGTGTGDSYSKIHPQHQPHAFQAYDAGSVIVDGEPMHVLVAFVALGSNNQSLLAQDYQAWTQKYVSGNGKHAETIVDNGSTAYQKLVLANVLEQLERDSKIISANKGNTLGAKPSSSYAPSPDMVTFKAWRNDTDIMPESDQNMAFPQHPHDIRGLNNEHPGRAIWFASSEAAEDWTGMLEGAVIAGELAADVVIEKLQETASDVELQEKKIQYQRRDGK